MMIIDGGNDFKVFYTIYRTQLSAACRESSAKA